MPLLAHEVSYKDVQQCIDKLIDNLVNITDETGEFLLKLEDGRVIDTKGWNDWEWTHGIGLYGLLKHWDITGDENSKVIIEEWFKNRFADGTPTKNINTVSPFLTLAYMQERTGKRSYLPYLDTWAEWVMHGLPRTEENGFQHIVFNSVNDQQLWDDTLMMSVLPLAKIGLLLDRPHYVEEAKRQFMLHVKYLADVKTGLWFHGWTFDGRHNFADALWARGNCWVTIAIPEFIELLNLPPEDGLRQFLIETLETQVKALAKYQHENGLWHTLLDDPSSYLEASATAGFAYGIMKAVRKRYLDDSYEEIAINAFKAVMENVDETGELQQVSFGTPVFEDLQGYKDIPLTSMPYGQSMAILACVEFMNRFKYAGLIVISGSISTAIALSSNNKKEIVMTERKITFKNYAGYGLGDALGAGSMAIISAWVLFFYTTYCGISPIQAGLIFAIARIIDAVASPLIGYISDNADNSYLGRKFGRRHIFLLISIPLLPSFGLMWVSGQHFLYYLCTYVFFELVYASVLIPYETLAAEMTHDFRKKAMFAGARIFVGHLSLFNYGRYFFCSLYDCCYRGVFYNLGKAKKRGGTRGYEAEPRLDKKCICRSV